MSEPSRIRAGDAERDQILGVLQRSFEEGRLDLSELHERQNQVLNAKFLDELAEVTTDLPNLPAVAADAGLVAAAQRSVPVAGGVDAGFTLSIMSGRQVSLAPDMDSASGFAWWGGNEYYLSDALGPGKVVTLNLSAIMGGHVVHVPAGVRVMDRTLSIMAGVTIAHGAQGDGSCGTLVLRGFVFWAGISVELDQA